MAENPRHPESHDLPGADAPSEARPESQAFRLGRRRFVQIGLGAAPVIMTIKARPAWAGKKHGKKGDTKKNSASLSAKMSAAPKP